MGKITYFLILTVLFTVPFVKVNAQDSDNTEDLFELSLAELMNVQIFSASKKAENQFDAPLSSTVLTSEEIINSGATTIEEALRLVPGVIVREETNGNFDIHIRGNDNVPPGSYTFFSENNLTLVMIDGRIVFNYINGGTFWETIPVSIVDVERIEIIRGASTALYGPNAVNGVINIITRRAAEKQVSVHGNAQVGTQNTGIFDVSAGTSLADDKLKIRLSGNYERRNRFQNTYYNYYTGSYVPATEIQLYNTGQYLDNPNEQYPDPDLAKDRKGVNGFLDYKANEDVDLRLSAGYQDSYAQTAFMGVNTTTITGRRSNSGYYNLNTNLHGFNIKLGGTKGTQDVAEGFQDVTQYDFNNLNTSLEYDWIIGNLSLRPGIAYQSATYSDAAYISESKPGNLNGEFTLSSIGFTLRADYQVKDKFRLVAALRSDKYNAPDDTYLTYQLIGTYNISKNHLVRVLYSKANRGPFVTDIYTNKINGDGINTPLVRFLGNKDIMLPVMNTFEIGYRGKLSEKVMLDIEAFVSNTENFTSTEPTYIGIDGNVVGITYEFTNIDIKTRQVGTTFMLNMPLSKKVQLKAYGTLQQTELENWDKKITPIILDPANGIFELPETERINTIHKQTPAFYGGITGNFRPVDKLNLWTGIFYVGSRVYRHDAATYNEAYGEDNLLAKTRVNLKASYQVYNGVNLFVNAINLLNNDTREFGFADESRGLYIAGVNFSF